MDRFKVTCGQCGKSDVVLIDNSRHIILDYDKKIATPLMAGRWRADHSWGWECVCGNYDMLAKEERKDFDKLVSGTPMRVMAIAKMVKSPANHLFKMESV